MYKHVIYLKDPTSGSSPHTYFIYFRVLELSIYPTENDFIFVDN